jgi:hypothetical protein
MLSFAIIPSVWFPRLPISSLGSAWDDDVTGCHHRRKSRMAVNGRIAKAMLCVVSLVVAFSGGCAGGPMLIHRRSKLLAEKSYGTIHVVDGVLWGGSLDMPAEGITLGEAVSKSVRPGAALASSQWGGDIPARPTKESSTPQKLEQWFVVLTRGGSANLIPASLVQYSPLGSLALESNDVVSVVAAEPFYGDFTLPSKPKVKVIEPTAAGLSSLGQTVVRSRDAENLTEIFGPGQSGYAAVHREVSGVRGTFLMHDADSAFHLAENDVVHWVHPELLHAVVSRERSQRGAVDDKGCLGSMRGENSATGIAFDQACEQLAASVRAAATYLRVPGVF